MIMMCVLCVSKFTRTKTILRPQATSCSLGPLLSVLSDIFGVANAPGADPDADAFDFMPPPPSPSNQRQSEQLTTSRWTCFILKEGVFT